QDRAAVGRLAALADDVAERADHFGERLLGRRAALVARTLGGRPDVLFVHPAVEDPDLHPAAVGAIPGRRPRRPVELVGRHRVQAGQPLAGDRAEVGEQFGVRAMTQRDDPRLVSLADVVPYVTAGVAAGRDRGDSAAVEHGLGADQVAITSWTSQPGSAGADQASASRLAARSAIADHSSPSRATTRSLPASSALSAAEPVTATPSPFPVGKAGTPGRSAP